MGRCRKRPKFDFQSQYSMSKIIPIFLNFLLIEEYHIFRYWNFSITSIFKSLYFLKWCPIYDTSPLTQFSKFNNFLWVCWFLGKNLSNFVPPVWKLHNPYCHNIHTQQPATAEALSCFCGLRKMRFSESVRLCSFENDRDLF